jgi:hypothetical protein
MPTPVGEKPMESPEPLDMDTMLEVLKVVDHLERVLALLKRLGSNMTTVESPSLEALEHLPRGIQFFEPGSSPFRPPKPVPIGLDLEEARNECGYCQARLDEILRKWYGINEASDGESGRSE